MLKLNSLDALVSLFYPTVCAGCGTDVDPSRRLCDECKSRLIKIVPPFCAKCSEPFAGAITNPFDCANCGHRKLYFAAAISAFRSRGLVRKIILDFKYGQQMHLRHLVAEWLFDAVRDERIRQQQFDVVVPVPLHPARQRERGFNQAAVLAKLISRRMAVETRPLLKRVRHTTTQTAFDRTERMQNLRGAFRLRRTADVQQLRVLLIDDVMTTGSTLSECARVLKKAGAKCIYAITAARA